MTATIVRADGRVVTVVVPERDEDFDERTELCLRCEGFNDESHNNGDYCEER